jgi:hypothetical protein
MKDANRKAMFVKTKEHIDHVNGFRNGRVGMLRKMEKNGELNLVYDRDHLRKYGVKVYKAYDKDGQLQGEFHLGKYQPNQWNHVHDWFDQLTYKQQREAYKNRR